MIPLKKKKSTSDFLSIYLLLGPTVLVAAGAVSDCGCGSQQCTAAILDSIATDSKGSYSCRARINWVMTTNGTTEREACSLVGNEFPSVCGQACDPDTCLIPRSTGKGKCPQLLWEDNFDGRALDTSKWEYQIGDGCNEGICGWGNNELQSYERDNVDVSNGILSIEARRQSLRGKQYTSGRIRTQGLADFQYGRLEASIKIPKGQGMWPAFWLLPTDWKFGGWPKSGEIDIMENVGREESIIHGTIHYGDAWPNNSNQGNSVTLVNGEAFHEKFHEFAIDWQPGVIRWTMDGAEYSVKTPQDISPEHWPFDERFHFILNVAVGGNWPGNPDGSTEFPQQMQVDYVRLYDKSFGRLKGAMAVQEREKNVVFSVEDPLADYSYDWSVPDGASIVTANPSTSSSIQVNFGTKSGYVAVTAASRQCQGTKKLSIPVRVGGGGSVSDCGCGSQCTAAILNRMATDNSGTYSCRDRINWVMSTRGQTEREACSLVANEFPAECGQGCDPDTCSTGGGGGGGTVSDCGCGGQCSAAILNRVATDNSGSYSCRDRINWVMSTRGASEREACSLVANEFPSVCGQGCNPDRCTGRRA